MQTVGTHFYSPQIGLVPTGRVADPNLHYFGSRIQIHIRVNNWLRTRITVKSWIRIRIKVIF
jgi:hypothetical protein